METLHRMETMGRGDLMENVELKNTEPEMKKSLGTSNSRLDYRRNNLWTWRWIQKMYPNWSTERKDPLKNQQRASVTCGARSSRLCVYISPRMRGREWAEKIFEEIITDNFPNLMKNINPLHQSNLSNIDIFKNHT